MPLMKFYSASNQSSVTLGDGTKLTVTAGYVSCDSKYTNELATAGFQPVASLTPANPNRIMGLRNPVVIPEVIFDQGPDGKFLFSQYDGTYGNFMARIAIAGGTTTALTGKTAIAATEPAAGLKNAAGTLLGSGDIFGAWWISATRFLFAVRSIGAPFGTGCCFLYLCNWNGSAWTVGNESTTFANKQAIRDLGTTGGVSVPNNVVLHARSLATNGSGKIMVGDYNVASGRVNGSTNDQVQVHWSTDSGVTWTKLLSWNTSGNQIRHVHGCKYDSYSGDWYILLGDAPNNCIVRWDGVSASPPDNTALANFSQYPGWEVLQQGWPSETGDLHIQGSGIMFLPDDIGPPNGAAQLRTVHLNREGSLSYYLGDYIEWFANQANPARAPLICCPLPGRGGLWGSLFDTSKDATRGFDFWATDPDGMSAYKIAQATDYSTSTAGTIWNMFLAANEQKVVISGADSRGTRLATNRGSIVATLTPWDGNVLQLN